MLPPNSHTASGSSVTVQDGVDRLWKYQLRKEHAALLEKLDSSNKTILAVSSEANRKFHEAAERIAALEAKFTKIEGVQENMRPVVEKWHKDLASLKAQMISSAKKQIPDGESIPATLQVEAEVRTVQTTDSPSEHSSIDHAAISKRVAMPDPASHLVVASDTLAGSVMIRTGSAYKTRASLKAPTSDRAVSKRDASLGECTSKLATSPDPIRNHFVTPCRPPIPNNIQNTDRGETDDNLSTPVASTVSKIQTLGSAAPRKHQAVSETIKIPTLSQRTSHLKTYHKNASAAFNALSKDRQTETQFVMQFLKGLRDSETRNTLTAALQSRHPCRSNQEGKLEILCEWPDVEDGLRNTGLIVVEAGDQAPPEPARKKQKILIPQDLVDRGLLRC
jgi:hypothetical protein